MGMFKLMGHMKWDLIVMPYGESQHALIERSL